MNSNMICNIMNSERLYLSKGEQDIYIDNCNIPQHHIDGIRFIYRLYLKKKPGCIINYKPGDSKHLQVVLFIKAILHTLKKPVLVLCNQEHTWMEHFQTWTNFYDEVEVTEKPLYKKSIQINTMCNLTQFSRNDWSVLIVDDDLLTHQVLKLPFKADYKIFITSNNMKKDLDKFSQIYAWLHPEEAKQKNMWKFNKNEFITDKNNMVDVLDKTIRLDAFMEDIVSYSFPSDARSEQHHTNRHITDYNPPITVSKKNKDATGTKIKRSKRKIYDVDDIIPSSTTTDDIKLPNDNKLPDKVENREQNEDIPHKKDSQGEDVEIDTLNSQSLDLYFEPDTETDVNSDKYYEMNTLVFSNDIISEDKGLNLNEPIKISNDLEININNSDKKDYNELDMDAESDEIVNIRLSKDSPINDINCTADNKLDTSPENSQKCSNGFKLDNDELDLKNSGKSPADMKDEYDDSPEKEIHIGKPFECGEGYTTNGNNVNDSLNEVQKGTKQDHLLEDTSVESETATEESKQDSFIKDIKSAESEIAAPVANTLKRGNSIEDKIKVMEENAMKKFKGSILDSLF